MCFLQILPIVLNATYSDGGLGVRRVSMLALPAFLASAASTLCLQDEILFHCQCRPDDPLVESYMSLWSASFGALPTGNASHKQAAWDRPGIEAIKDELMTIRADPPPRPSSSHGSSLW